MFRKSILTILAAALLLTACATSLTDGLNRTVKLPGAPRRIVSLAPSNTEILYAVGAGKQDLGIRRCQRNDALGRSVQFDGTVQPIRAGRYTSRQ